MKLDELGCYENQLIFLRGILKKIGSMLIYVSKNKMPQILRLIIWNIQNKPACPPAGEAE